MNNEVQFIPNFDGTIEVLEWDVNQWKSYGKFYPHHMEDSLKHRAPHLHPHVKEFLEAWN